MRPRGWDLDRRGSAHHEASTAHGSLVLLHILGAACTRSLETLLLLLVCGEVSEVAPALDSLRCCAAGVR